MHLAGVSSLLGGINILVTLGNMRAVGMCMSRMSINGVSNVSDECVSGD
jgi:heme/copper-type cytochrome/quinol oxidase subunit 1